MQDVGRLLSLISHEVRAPLGVVRGYLRLLEQHAGGWSEQQRHAVAAALKASDRATEILNQVSTLARLHRAEPALSNVPTPLAPLVRAAISDVTLPREPTVAIRIGDIPDMAVVADAALLKGAIAALTTAVVKAQAVDATVQVRAEEQHDDDQQGVLVTISVLDAPRPSPAGAPLDLSRGGLGLELAIAAFVIELHQGVAREQRLGPLLTGMELWLPLRALPTPLAPPALPARDTHVG
jgi:signal transduction histidine kinase